jgi:hypothetical protein
MWGFELGSRGDARDSGIQLSPVCANHPFTPRSGDHEERLPGTDLRHPQRVTERRSKQTNRFVAAILTVALFLS